MEKEKGFTTVELLERLETMDIETLEFVHQEAKSHLENMVSVSRRIGERSFNLLGIIVASYSLLITAISYLLSNSKITMLLMTFGVLVSVWYLFKATKPFKSGLTGMAPEDMNEYIQYGKHEPHKSALLLCVYTIQYNISNLSKKNDDRSALYTRGCWIFFATCIIAALLISFL